MSSKDEFRTISYRICICMIYILAAVVMILEKDLFLFELLVNYEKIEMSWMLFEVYRYYRICILMSSSLNFNTSYNEKQWKYFFSFA